MFLTEEQLVVKVLVIECMFSGFIRNEMYKQNIIISLCLNFHESRISA